MIPQAWQMRSDKGGQHTWEDGACFLAQAVLEPTAARSNGLCVLSPMGVVDLSSCRRPSVWQTKWGPIRVMEIRQKA